MSWSLISAAIGGWFRHRCPRLGAALAFYALFSLGPLLLIVISVAGFLFGEAEAREAVIGGFRDRLGESGSRAVAALLEGAASGRAGLIAAATGGVLLLVAAAGAVVQLKDALNTIWEVEPGRDGGWFSMARDYLASLAGIAMLGVLLAALLVFNTAVAAVTGGAEMSGLWHLINLVASLGLLTLVFAALFYAFPDAPVEWRDVWPAAAATAVLFQAGTLAISWYIGTQGLSSTYGAAASLVALLIWIYYSAQIVLLGAELSRAAALARSRQI